MSIAIFTKQKKNFINQVKALNKGQTIDPEFIWRSLIGVHAQQNVSYFCLQIYENLMQVQKKSYVLNNQQNIYATLLAIQLYNNKKIKSAKFLQECSDYFQKMQQNYGKNLLLFLFNPQRQKYVATFFISRLAMAPDQINWSQKIQTQAKRQLISNQQYIKSKIKHGIFHKNYQSLKNPSFPKYNAPQTKLLTFGYICFIDHIKSNKFTIQKYQYQHLLDTLKFVINCVSTVVLLEQYLPIILHFIIKCITYYGCFEEDIVKDLLIMVNQLRNFAGIIGKLSQQLFTILYQQLKIPGYTFHKKIRQFFPSLDITQHKFLNKQYYLITDTQQMYNQHQNISLLTLRKLIIIHILKISNIQQNIINNFYHVLKYLNDESTFGVYDKLVRIMEVGVKIENRSKIKIVLHEYIGKLVKQTIQKYQKQVNMLKNKQNQSIQQQQFQQLYKKINKNGIFQYPNPSIITVPISDFISNKDNVYTLTRIVQKSKSDYQSKSMLKNKISLIFHADAHNFIKFVESISKFLENTQIQYCKQFKIYYIPRYENNVKHGIGLYMLTKDAWYRKFLYNIHCQKILYPHIDVKPGNKDLFPFYLFNKSLQLYIRQANNSIQMRVYKCTLKKSSISYQQFVYMSSYFGLGLFCQARIIKTNKQMQKNKQQRNYSKQLIQIIDDKIKKGPVSTLNLQIQCIQPFTQGIKLKKQRNVRIEDLQICNLSSQYFLGKPPNPSSANLQMSILNQINGKIFRKQISHSDYFKQNRSIQQVYHAFKQLFIVKTIRSIFIQNANKNNSLIITIDGIIYNNLQSIKIQPVISVSQIPVTLQLQTFLPV